MHYNVFYKILYAEMYTGIKIDRISPVSVIFIQNKPMLFSANIQRNMVKHDMAELKITQFPASS